MNDAMQNINPYDIGSMIWSIILVTVFAPMMYFTYKYSYDKLSYNHKFNATLVVIAYISSGLSSLVQNNIGLSIGILGCLSLVGFKATIKDYRDIGFIFWALFIGLCSSTHNLTYLTLISLILSAFNLLTSMGIQKDKKLLLIIRGKNEQFLEVQSIVENSKAPNKLKTKNLLSDSFELVYELHIKNDEDNDLIQKLLKLESVDSVNVLSPNTKVT